MVGVLFFPSLWEQGMVRWCGVTDRAKRVGNTQVITKDHFKLYLGGCLLANCTRTHPMLSTIFHTCTVYMYILGTEVGC